MSHRRNFVVLTDMWSLVRCGSMLFVPLCEFTLRFLGELEFEVLRMPADTRNYR